MMQLAKFRHYGGPTRLIDISFNPYIAAWFAVSAYPATANCSDKDGRLFAIDVTHHLITESTERDYSAGKHSVGKRNASIRDERLELRTWEGSSAIPWANINNKSDYAKGWTTRALVWRPSPFLSHRIMNQDGGFILGGVPQSHDGIWQININNQPIEVTRKAISVPVRPTKIQKSGGLRKTKSKRAKRNYSSLFL